MRTNDHEHYREQRYCCGGPNPDLVPRKAQNLIAEALTDTRVVTLNGARQAGKSTLARLAARASPDAVIRRLVGYGYGGA
jgi:predicted AAA+ superfamily ATPase